MDLILEIFILRFVPKEILKNSLFKFTFIRNKKSNFLKKVIMRNFYFIKYNKRLF